MSSAAVKAPRPHRVMSLAGAACAAAVVSLGLCACGSSGTGAVEKAPKVKSSATTSASPSSGTAGGAATGTGTGTGTGGGGAGTGTGTGTGGGGGGGGGGGITLNVNQTATPLCAGGTNLAPIAGQGIAFTYTSTGATNVTLNIDGGLYGTYGPSDSVSLAFPCSGAEGSTVTHTYTFTTVPGGASKTLTASATQHVQTNVGDGGGGGMMPPPPSTSSSP